MAGSDVRAMVRFKKVLRSRLDRIIRARWIDPPPYLGLVMIRPSTLSGVNESASRTPDPKSAQYTFEASTAIPRGFWR